MLAILADGVENPANLTRIHDAASLLGASSASKAADWLIALENAPGATSIYGRRPLSSDATLAVGNERRGLSQRTMARADEVIEIPTLSRKVNTLNVAAAAAVAGWYVLRGSAPQRRRIELDARRPSLLIVGDDHVEIGSSLRSAAAFGFRDVLLDDRSAGWFSGSPSVRREAYAAARRHKNALRVHPANMSHAARFAEIVVVVPTGCGRPIQRAPLARGPRQLVIIGATEADLDTISASHPRVATLELSVTGQPPLRLVSSIAMAEVARQVGARKPTAHRERRHRPTYERAFPAISAGEVLVVEEEALLGF